MERGTFSGLDDRPDMLLEDLLEDPPDRGSLSVVVVYLGSVYRGSYLAVS